MAEPFWLKLKQTRRLGLLLALPARLAHPKESGAMALLCSLQSVLVSYVLLLLLASSFTAWGGELPRLVEEGGAPEHSALAADDACGAAFDPTMASKTQCALSALQRRTSRGLAAYIPPCTGDCQGLYHSRWCMSKAPADSMWRPQADGTALQVKVLSYNLYWWNLFGKRGGNDNSAGNLIKQAVGSQPFDFMGFQECEDPVKVLGPVGLLSEYEAVQGDYAICMAYRKSAWSLIAKSSDDVAEDMPTQHYGRRAVQWIRLRHQTSGRTAFFMNHHGPLSVNSGGACGGESTANNLMAVVHLHAEVGDLVVLVGDFNSNAASTTIQYLWRQLTHVHVGDTWAGVDNIFSNVDPSDIVETHILGSGGSDHNAIAAVVRAGSARPDVPISGQQTAGRSAAATAVAMLTAPGAEGQVGGDPATWETFWCGLMEFGIKYDFDPGMWEERAQLTDPQQCCHECQRYANCHAWFITSGGGPPCVMKGAGPSSRSLVEGAISGLAVGAAANAAASFHSALLR